MLGPIPMCHNLTFYMYAYSLTLLLQIQNLNELQEFSHYPTCAERYSVLAIRAVRSSWLDKLAIC